MREIRRQGEGAPLGVADLFRSVQRSTRTFDTATEQLFLVRKDVITGKIAG
jgi:hypothetical protein